MANYFWRPKPIGLNANIKQHMKEQGKLERKIEELENIEHPTEMEIRTLRTYRHFLTQLLQSKADIVSKLGKNK